MKRKIIEIDEEKCTGCGRCIPGCAEGALKIIDGKARLLSDLFCDGLGACIGHCPEQAITVIEREAEPYDEEKVLDERILPAGRNTLKEHLLHLKSHGAKDYLEQAEAYLQRHHIENPLETDEPEQSGSHHPGCPGSRSRSFVGIENAPSPSIGSTSDSELSHWPIQLHLVNPKAPHFHEAELLIAADCTAFSRADFHSRFLRGKKLIIACPKLEQGHDIYLQKLNELVTDAKIRSLSVLRMEVPCCAGLTAMVRHAVSLSGRTIPVKETIIGIEGDIVGESESPR